MDQALPERSVFVITLGALDGIEAVAGRKVIEHQAVALFPVLVERLDVGFQRVLAIDDGNGAVPQGDELAQFIRLMTGWQEEQIGGCVEFMDQGLGKQGMDDDLRGMSRRNIAKRGFPPAVLRPDDDQLEVLERQCLQDLYGQPGPFLIEERRHEGHKGDAPLPFQSNTIAQGLFVLLLASPGVGIGIMPMDYTCRRRCR